jgi:hypothetical protein
MKRRTAYFVGTGLFLLLLVAFGIFGLTGENPLYSHDSPITITGGSIHAGVGTFNFNSWKPKVSGKSYSTQSNNSDQITVEGFTPGITTSPLTGTGGWVITVADSTYPNAIQFCSDPNCSEKLFPNNEVFIQTNGQTQWEEKTFRKTLEFHNLGQNCKDGSCDHISAMTITTATNIGNTNGVTYTCSMQSSCVITVGHH